MTTSLSIALATGLGLAFTGPALAGGLSAPTTEAGDVFQAEQIVPFARASRFAGAYAGAQLGYGDVDLGNGAASGGDAVFGLHLGYNLDLGNSYLIGAELDYDAGDIALSGGNGALDSVARLKLRGGYDMGGTLLYATFGAARADTSALGADEGAFIGFGAAVDLGNQISLGGEYLTHKFDNFAGSGNDVDADTLSARVSYNF